jgi:predicted nucleotidyltransferase
MTDALAAPKPRIDDPDELDRLVRQIVAKVDPVAIYLFGSRARGDADDDSDYDLMIVVPDDFPAGQANTHTAFQCVEGRRIPIDAVMVRRGRFRERAAQVGTLSHQVNRDGVLLYERADRP